MREFAVFLRKCPKTFGQDCRVAGYSAIAPFSVFEDIPKEMYNLRKSQFSKFKEAKRNGHNVYFSKKYPDKLYINGKFIPPNEIL